MDDRGTPLEDVIYPGMSFEVLEAQIEHFSSEPWQVRFDCALYAQDAQPVRGEGAIWFGRDSSQERCVIRAERGD
jgi:hypothetical protein